jgi:hypothetical protein
LAPFRPSWACSTTPTQRIKSTLTSCTGYGSLIGNVCIESSSLTNPAEQVGTHSGGGVGCLAELGSDGIAGCSAAPLGIGKALLQALKSGSSTSSISAGHLQLLFGIVLHLIKGRDTAFCFLQGSHGGESVTLCNLGFVVSQRGDSLGGIGLGHAHPHLLAAGNDHQRQRPPRPAGHSFQQADHSITSSIALA